jgi:hypothetical protein
MGYSSFGIISDDYPKGKRILKNPLDCLMLDTTLEREIVANHHGRLGGLCS